MGLTEFYKPSNSQYDWETMESQWIWREPTLSECWMSWDARARRGILSVSVTFHRVDLMCTVSYWHPLQWLLFQTSHKLTAKTSLAKSQNHLQCCNSGVATIIPFLLKHDFNISIWALTSRQLDKSKCYQLVAISLIGDGPKLWLLLIHNAG